MLLVYVRHVLLFGSGHLPQCLFWGRAFSFSLEFAWTGRDSYFHSLGGTYWEQQPSAALLPMLQLLRVLLLLQVLLTFETFSTRKPKSLQQLSSSFCLFLNSDS